MSHDATIPQGEPERRRARELSLESGSPPTPVPGYEPERLLGVGAYGEVWVAVERNTGRRVAIKFYAHRGGLDWSLLAREVEKLAFLFADRYVVQLIGVGWDADPPYYIMEYLEHGSLADRLQEGRLSVAEAVELFRDVAVGLAHAHGKGVLHCDLKPANILLDQDGKPRLADFGQSRLSHEQAPALGTLFYMAPEQADLEAVPDARWDVYALGALLYCMLTGSPPHRTAEAIARLDAAENLEHRLTAYRRLIRAAPSPAVHRQMPGVDRALAEILDRCLAPEPRRRYPNVQAVLAALDARSTRRALRPAMVLGAVGPALLLLVVTLFAWRGFTTALGQSEKALTERALKVNRFAAMFVARAAEKELERRYEAVEQVAADDDFLAAVAEILDQPETKKLFAALSDPQRTAAELEPLRKQFRENPLRKKLQQTFEDAIPPRMLPPAEPGQEEQVSSWFFCDPSGVSTCRLGRKLPAGDPVGKDYAWRSFFHGDSGDHPPTWRPAPGQHVERTKPSAVFPSSATRRWIVAVSTPVRSPAPQRRFLGVVALTVEVGRFVELQRDGNPDRADPFAVLVDWRDGPNKGAILQHPLFRDPQFEPTHRVPDRFLKYRVTAASLPDDDPRIAHYHDPLADDPAGTDYRRDFLAYYRPIEVRGEKPWRVIVQVAYDEAIGSTLAGLRRGLLRYGILAGAMVVVIVAGVWVLALRLLSETSPGRLPAPPSDGSERPSTSLAAVTPTEPHRRD